MNYEGILRISRNLAQLPGAGSAKCQPLSVRRQNPHRRRARLRQNDPRHRADQTPECEHAHFGTLHHDSGAVGSQDSGSLFMRRIRTGGLRLSEPEAAEGHYGRNLSGASQCNDHVFAARKRPERIPPRPTAKKSIILTLT